MCLARSNILEPPVFLDRIAICEIKIKIIIFYFQKYKNFIYENLLKPWFFSCEKNHGCVPKVTSPFKWISGSRYWDLSELSMLYIITMSVTH